MGALEQNLENFLDNNTPGGYIQTNVSISNNEIEALINEKINNRGFITNAQETDPTVPAWAKQSVKPTYTAQEVGAIPNNGVSISNTLSAGEGRSRIATITINGTSTDIYNDNSSSSSTSTTIDYNDLINKPSLESLNNFARIAFTGDYNDLIANVPDFSSTFDEINDAIVDINDLEYQHSQDLLIEQKYIIEIPYNENFNNNTNYSIIYSNSFIEDIVNLFNQNKINILLQYGNNFYYINNYYSEDGYFGISFFKIDFINDLTDINNQIVRILKDPASDNATIEFIEI